MMIKVRAVFPDGGFGFDGLGRRRDGDEFAIDETKFDENWMRRVDSDPEPAPEPEKATTPEPKTRRRRSTKKAVGEGE